MPRFLYCPCFQILWGYSKILEGKWLSYIQPYVIRYEHNTGNVPGAHVGFYSCRLQTHSSNRTFHPRGSVEILSFPNKTKSPFYNNTRGSAPLWTSESRGREEEVENDTAWRSWGLWCEHIFAWKANLILKLMAAINKYRGTSSTWLKCSHMSLLPFCRHYLCLKKEKNNFKKWRRACCGDKSVLITWTTMVFPRKVLFFFSSPVKQSGEKWELQLSSAHAYPSSFALCSLK